MRKSLTKNFWNIEVWAVQKHVNLVDLVKSFPTNIYLQNLASIQKRTSLVKFAHLAEKSGKGSISNLSTKVWPPPAPFPHSQPSPITVWLRSEVSIELNFPPKLRGARSRLYRRRFLQVKTRWKALAEIYTMHSFAPIGVSIFFRS